MAALTWREVSAPDFRGAMQGFDNFSQTLNNAFNIARSTAQGVDNSITDRVNAEIMARIAGAQEVDQAKALAANILADPNNVRRMRDTTFSAVRNMPGDIMTRLTAEDTFKRSREKQAIFDQLNPLSAQFQSLLLKGDPTSIAQAQKLRDENMGLIGKLTPEEQSPWLMGEINTEKALMNLNSMRRADRKDIYVTDDFFADEDRTKEANKVLAAITQQGTSDFATAKKYVDSLGIQDAELYNGLIGKLKESFPAGDNPFAIRETVDLDFTPGSGSANRQYRNGSPYNAVLGDGKYGLPTKNVSEMTMGEIVDFGQSVLIPKTRAAGVGKINGKTVGSSAVGAYQIVNTTMVELAKQMYPDNWRDVKFTPAVQDRMAEYLFNTNKHGNLKKTWEGLPDSRPGAYANLSWPEMREIILAKEVGNSGGGSKGPGAKTIEAALQKGPVTVGELEKARAGLTKSDVTQEENEFFRAFKQNAARETTPLAEAQRIAGLKPNIKAEYLVNQIAAIQKKYGVNTAIAGQIVERAIRTDQSKTFFTKDGGWTDVITPDVLMNKGTYVDKGVVEKLGKLVGQKGENAVRRAGVLSKKDEVGKILESRLEAAKRARARLDQAKLAAQTAAAKGQTLDISGAIADERQASALLRMAVDEAAGLADDYLSNDNPSQRRSETAKPKPKGKRTVSAPTQTRNSSFYLQAYGAKL